MRDQLHDKKSTVDGSATAIGSSGSEGGEMWHHVVSGGAMMRAFGCALAYMLAAVLGNELTREPGQIAVFWPANALLMGLLLRMRRRDYPISLAACVLGATLLNLHYGDEPGIAVTRASVNILEVLCGYHLIARFSPNFTLTDLRSLYVLSAASMAAPAVSATAAVFLLGESNGVPFTYLWWVRWSRDAIAMLFLLPLVASFDLKPVRRLLFGRPDRQQLAEAAELAIAFTLLLAVFGLIIREHWYNSPTLFAPVLLWIALRFGIFATAAAALTIDVFAVVSAAYDAWPNVFANATTPQEILSLQVFVILVALPPLVVAVVVGERTGARRQLDNALEGMADAFALYDSEGRLVLCNSRYPEFLSRIADRLVPGTRYEELIREGARRGLYPAVPPEQAETWIA
jgi:integral membrane sensor domain MASE1